MFMAQEPQMPSRQDRLNVNVESSLFLILIKISKTIGPQLQVQKIVYAYNCELCVCNDKLCIIFTNLDQLCILEVSA